MAERKPWICPRCDAVVAPHVDTHRCGPDGGVKAVLGGGDDPGPISVTGSAWPQTWTSTTTTNIPGGVVTTTG
jgi:hypothetical protein